MDLKLDLKTYTRTQIHIKSIENTVKNVEAIFK